MFSYLEETVERIRRHPRLVIAEDFEVAAQHTQSCRRKFHNGNPVERRQEDSSWISLRILHRQQPGRSVIHSISDHSIDSLVDNAFDSAKASKGDPWFKFPIWKPPSALEWKVPVVVSGESIYPSLSMPPAALEEAYDSRHILTLLHRKSEKFQLKQVQPFHKVDCSVFCSDRHHVVSLRESRAWSTLPGDRQSWLIGLVETGHRLIGGADWRAKGRTTLILSAAAFSSLLRRLAPWFYADCVRRGLSPISIPAPDSQSLFSPVITILDKGNYPNAAYAVVFDMEGSVTQETSIVEHGMLRNLLYDSYSARKENRLSTGNFLRLQDSVWPAIHASTMFVKPSSDSVATVLSAVSEAILLERIFSLDLISGSRTRYVIRGAGFRLNRGAVVETLSTMSLELEVLDLMRRAIAVGNDLTLYGCFGAPSAVFENVPLGS